MLNIITRLIMAYYDTKKHEIFGKRYCLQLSKTVNTT
jgi:hypothetical protein